jgi:hypothetical protein
MTPDEASAQGVSLILIVEMNQQERLALGVEAESLSLPIWAVEDDYAGHALHLCCQQGSLAFFARAGSVVRHGDRSEWLRG